MTWQARAREAFRRDVTERFGGSVGEILDTALDEVVASYTRRNDAPPTAEAATMIAEAYRDWLSNRRVLVAGEGTVLEKLADQCRRAISQAVWEEKHMRNGMPRAEPSDPAVQPAAYLQGITAVDGTYRIGNWTIQAGTKRHHVFHRLHSANGDRDYVPIVEFIGEHIATPEGLDATVSGLNQALREQGADVRITPVKEADRVVGYRFGPVAKT